MITLLYMSGILAILPGAELLVRAWDRVFPPSNPAREELHYG